MSKEDIEIIKSVIYNQNEQQMDYIDIDNITPNEECKTFITAIEHLIKAYKELEEENKIYRRQLNSAFDRGFIHKDKIINLIKTKFIEYDCEDCITGKFIEVEDVEELLKDGGE